MRSEAESGKMGDPSGEAPPDNRRQHQRVTGPFDGRRLGLLDTPVRIYDISEGGCFVNSSHEQKLGITIALEIDLPFEGLISVKAETLYKKPGFGYAVRFVEMSEETSARLHSALDQLKAENRGGD